MREKGCPWGDYACVEAYKCGMDMLTFAHSLGCPMTVEVLNEAAKKGDIPALEYCLSKVIFTLFSKEESNYRIFRSQFISELT